MAMKTLHRSFAGGEIAPELFGRIDLDKFQTGLATCQNFIVLPHGPVRNRQGFRYINEVKYSDQTTALIEFSYSTTQTYVLEFGNLYVRFHTNGSTLLETAKSISSISGDTVAISSHGYTAGKWVYIGGRYYVIESVATNTFVVNNLDGTTGAPSGATAAQVYEIATPYTAAHVMDIHHVQSADVLTLVHPSYEPRELKRLGAANWTLTTISFVPTILPPSSISSSATGTGGTINYTYAVTSIADNELEESVLSSSTTVTNDITVAGQYNTISFSSVSGAVRYNVYKQKNGLFGYIGQTDATSFKDDNINADVTRTPPESDNPFSGSGNYPSTVSYFEQRRCFGGTDNRPQNFWMTRSGTESNMNYSIPTQDDDAITIRIAAREVNRIRHIVPLSDLVLLTTSGEWRVWAQNSDAITPSTMSVRPQSYNGANNVQPVVTGSSTVYVRNQSSRLHELTYSWESNAYKSEDVSLMSPHLFDNYSMVDLSITRTPVPIIWTVRNDGLLLGMTYMPTQKIWAWHKHNTAGLFKSIAAISEDEVDVLYAVISRTVNGRAVQYIERLDASQTVALEDAFHVDSGLTYSGSATTSITGLWHLEGKTVSILANGSVHPTRTVTNGAITLQIAATLVHIGLPIEADIKTLPVSLEMQAFAQGREKNINKLWMRVHNSSGIKAGPSFDKLTEYKQRTTEPYGSPPSVITKEIQLMLSPSWSDSGQVCIRQADPLPLSILSMVLEVALGG